MVVIGDDVPDTVAAMFGCAVLTGMGAVLNTAAVAAGQSVAVFGLGAVGLSSVMAAALAGASAVIAIDPNKGKHQLAFECGATAVGTPDDAARLVAEATGDGVDVAVEAVGVRRSHRLVPGPRDARRRRRLRRTAQALRRADGGGLAVCRRRKAAARRLVQATPCRSGTFRSTLTIGGPGGSPWNSSIPTPNRWRTSTKASMPWPPARWSAGCSGPRFRGFRVRPPGFPGGLPHFRFDGVDHGPDRRGTQRFGPCHGPDGKLALEEVRQHRTKSRISRHHEVGQQAHACAAADGLHLGEDSVA